MKTIKHSLVAAVLFIAFSGCSKEHCYILNITTTTQPLTASGVATGSPSTSTSQTIECGITDDELDEIIEFHRTPRTQKIGNTNYQITSVVSYTKK